MANLVGAEDDPRVAMTEKILKTILTLIDKTIQRKVPLRVTWIERGIGEGERERERERFKRRDTV